MAISYLCVLIAGLLPYVFTGLAKLKSGTYGPTANKDPRKWQETLTGWPKRLNNAHQNSFEIFPFFAAAVLTAHQTGVTVGTIDKIAMVFIASRVVYGYCYARDLGSQRSLVWSIGVVCIMALFILALKLG